jgi:hypothetical protein
MGQIPEWDISIRPGRGCVGIAWTTGEPKVLIAPFEGDEDLDPADAACVNRDLQWIISVPVRVDGVVKWIVNVDGEDRLPRADVEAAVPDVQAIVPVLAPFGRKV